LREMIGAVVGEKLQILFANEDDWELTDELEADFFGKQKKSNGFIAR